MEEVKIRRNENGFAFERDGVVDWVPDDVIRKLATALHDHERTERLEAERALVPHLEKVAEQFERQSLVIDTGSKRLDDALDGFGERSFSAGYDAGRQRLAEELIADEKRVESTEGEFVRVDAKTLHDLAESE